MKTRFLWCITLVLLCHPRVGAQAVTTQFPPAAGISIRAANLSADGAADLPDDPSLQSALPEAQVVPQPPKGSAVKLVARTQTRQSLPASNLYTLDGDVVIYYRSYIVHADHATYDDNSGEIVAKGHLMIDGGPDDEHFVASRGVVDVYRDTGKFFDVVGTLGVARTPRGRMVFTAPNPFALTGREVEQLGRGHYKVIHGTMTSCMLPNPDWRILSENIELNNGVAKTSNGFFEAFRVPLFYLPYMTHPVEEQRQSGFLLPYFGQNTTKGVVVGEGFYLTLGRSADLTMATQWWSKRGWAPNGLFRYHGLGQNFATAHFHSLLDKGFREPDGSRLNQGGVDISTDARYDFSPQTSGAIDAEYLSSYVYRLVFEEDYAIAINSEVKSQAFLTHEDKDMWASLRLNRYQNFQNANVPGDEVRILHIPELDVEAADRRLGGAESVSPLMWGFSGSAAALSRYDFPSFRTTASVPRVDFSPRISLPLHFDGWSFRPAGSIRETWYGKAQESANLDQIPVVRREGIARMDVETGFELRPPALERDFTAPWLERWLGGDLRHAIEPELRYRYVTGINNFRDILRFDETEVASNTNEAEYGLTQRLFLRNVRPHPCKGDEALGPQPLCGGGTRDWITWRVAQKYYFEPDFDHAITRGTPNPLQTTLDFTGVDFLTEARHTTPVISRLRMQTTTATNLEWDLDYDTKEGKITSSNVFAAYQRGVYRFQFGDAYMNVPLGTTPLTTARTPPGLPDAPEPFNQIHVTAVRGAGNKLGLSEGLSAVYDLVHQQLQFGAAQAQYNWNCCGIDFQYRRFSLGSIRDDTEYFWSINLAGFSNVGDLTHRISLF
ncbi:MAG TPA: LPS assembly protein LptD [Acidobacteriaceae bacterium]|nr:LPS assembly protein LptD [Acidobacteriaceae bacterium]